MQDIEFAVYGPSKRDKDILKSLQVRGSRVGGRSLGF